MTALEYEMLEALELLQGFGFRLDESPHGIEIRLRAENSINKARTKKQEEK